MFKRSMERLHQLVAVAAIGVLAVAPFASSITGFGQNVGLRSSEGLDESAESAPARSARGECRTPSYEELPQSLEQLRSARMELLRCAAQQGDDDVQPAVLRYQVAIQEWKTRFQKVLERSYAEDAQNFWYEFCAMRRSEDDDRRIYAWELDRFAVESN